MLKHQANHPNVQAPTSLTILHRKKCHLLIVASHFAKKKRKNKGRKPDTDQFSVPLSAPFPPIYTLFQQHISNAKRHLLKLHQNVLQT